MIERIVPIPKRPKHTFFLWGPRKTGKSTWIRHLYPEAIRINLLLRDQFIKYSLNPSLLREELLAQAKKAVANRFVVIDEIQKVPELLDEVHNLIEEHGFVFCLCGSSARKLKRGHANLLGGRALRYEMHGLTYKELKNKFDLVQIINRGAIPSHYLESNFAKQGQAYLQDYLKEEIAEEGLVQNLPVFADFLRSAAFSDSEIINYTNIASDCGVSSQTVKNYFQILVDTLVGHYLPAYTRRPKRKVIHSPKFYYFDVIIPNLLAKRGDIQLGSQAFGKAFECWLHHELRSYLSYREKNDDLAYWRLADTGHEVDFVINDFEIAIEAKGSPKLRSDDFKGLRALKEDHSNVGKRLIVCLEKTRRLTEDGVLVLPVVDFLEGLWAGEWI